MNSFVTAFSSPLLPSILQFLQAPKNFTAKKTINFNLRCLAPKNLILHQTSKLFHLHYIKICYLSLNCLPYLLEIVYKTRTDEETQFYYTVREDERVRQIYTHYNRLPSKLSLSLSQIHTLLALSLFHRLQIHSFRLNFTHAILLIPTLFLPLSLSYSLSHTHTLFLSFSLSLFTGMMNARQKIAFRQSFEVKLKKSFRS